MAADLGLIRAVQAVAVYLALTWIGVLCFGFAVLTVLLDAGGLAPAGRQAWVVRLLLVLLGALGLAGAVVGIGGLLFG
jgi:hypothetical protein